ncbi:MAG: hypothetical protein L0H94_12755 [Nitrospira sp.]|nr:hypothetical protein [Nitrospira sp.]
MADILMLIIGGRERTKKESAELFGEAGLRLTRVVPTKEPLRIVEGVRACSTVFSRPGSAPQA